MVFANAVASRASVFARVGEAEPQVNRRILRLPESYTGKRLRQGDARSSVRPDLGESGRGAS